VISNLRQALADAGVGVVDVAARLGVDPKTVERWCAGKRLPYPSSRQAISSLTGWREADLWPDAARSTSPPQAAADVRVTYPRRSAVPIETWRRLFESARRSIDVLVFSGLFLVEDAATINVLRDQARAGVNLRFALGDPEGRHIAQRGIDEGIGDAMSARIRNALVLLRPLFAEPSFELRLHDTVLYNSIYRADDDMIVNTHIHGRPASYAPVMWLRGTSTADTANTYRDSFECVWSVAQPATR
jgi:hypothetical protein